MWVDTMSGEQTQVLCFVVRDNAGKIEVLLLKRTPEKGGFWQPVCGGVSRKDISTLRACIREMREEINLSESDIIITHQNIHTFTVKKHYLTGKPIKPVKEYVFAVMVKNNFSVDISKNPCKEHSAFAWVSLDKAEEMLKWKENIDALKKLKKVLQNEKERKLQKML